MDKRIGVRTESFGALLRRYRGSRGLTQEELAERAGLHAQEISRLERDVVRNPRSTSVEFLADALKLEAREREAFAAAARRESARPVRGPNDELGLAQQPPVGLADAESLFVSMPTDVLPSRAPLPTGSHVPLAPNPLFVGRGDEMLAVARALRGEEATVALGQVVASTGLGGLGKTQLAVELVHRYGRYFAGGVFWLSFASADEIPLQVAGCAEPGLETRPLQERIRRVKEGWQNAVPRLLVFDNCEDESLLEAWRPTSGGCRVLVTSRRSEWSPTLGVTALPLDLLPRADSIELLRRYLPGLAADDPGPDTLAAELGDLPLALHLAGSYLRSYRAEVSLSRYLVELRRSDVVQHASLLGAGLDDSPSPTHHVQSVAQTFALCLSRLDPSREVDRVAIALLARIASMAPGEPVPRNLLAKTMEDVDPRLRSDGIRRLAAAGLVEHGESWLRLHRLLAYFVRKEGLETEAQTAVVHALVGCGEDAYAGQLTGTALAALIPHLVGVAGATDEDGGDEQMAAELCSAWALDIRELAPGPEQPNADQCLSRPGGLLRNLEALSAARPLLERALALCQQVLGPDHPHSAHPLSGLARVLRNQGELAAARPLSERALAIRERVLGRSHPLTATSLHGLAALHRDSGDPTAARPLLERALAIRERVLGPDHPDTVATRSALAELAVDGGGPAEGG